MSDISTAQTETTEAAAVPSFHAGEQELQRRIGVADRMQAFASRAIRSFMPQQHRDFFALLPFVVVAAVDEAGAPWITLVAGQPGFLESPDDRTLNLRATFGAEDPVGQALKVGARAGLLGIELPTRRRNRLSAEVRSIRDGVYELGVLQSFGNCPQYIQTRDPHFVDERSVEPAVRFTTLSQAHRRRIASADTFFVGSAVPAGEGVAQVTHGADASHRGGQPGFVKVEGDLLTVPEYPGNLLFNTMGNFLLYPRAGLCFVDFTTGSLLLLTGTVELMWEPDALTQAFAGAERAWRFRLDHGVEIPGALPLRFDFTAWSPNTLLTGDWDQAESRRRAEALRNRWRTHRVTRVVDEAQDIRSFYLEPTDGNGVPEFQPGQFLTIRVPAGPAGALVTRNYSVSSAPHDPHLRLSIKRERHDASAPFPAVSAWLHEHLAPGHTLEAIAPRGDFWLDVGGRRPVVLLAAGIGVTPLLAMARAAVTEAFRMRRPRGVTFIHVARNLAARPFHDELRELAVAQPAFRFVSVLTQPEPDAKAGSQFQASGRLSADLLQSLLPIDDYDFYLCGPGGFVQGAYDLLLGLGVRDGRIHAEAFGPSTLVRKLEATAALPPPPPEAADCIVQFKRAGFEQRWNAGDATLLETAEAHGLSPPYSCRSGTCGSCVTRCLGGAVVYRTPPTAPLNEGEILLCCSVPAAGTTEFALDL